MGSRRRPWAGPTAWTSRGTPTTAPLGTTPPPDDHRYRRAYQGVTPGRGQGTADARTGRVTAYVNAGALAGRANAYGGVGAEIRPKAVLSYLTVTASQNLTVEHRFHFLTYHAFGGSSITEYDCVAGVGVAHVDPVTGAWEWLNPVRTRPFVRVTYTGLQGMPLSSRTYALDDLATTVQVQGGGTYVAATWVEATIVPQILDVGGRPYQKKPEDQVLLYAQLIGHAPTIRTATTVLV